MRKRVTVTIKEDILNQVDRLVDNVSIRSRSQAFEYILTKYMTDFALQNVLVLAGGKSHRLKELTKDKHRTMIEIQGKPILKHVLDYIHSFAVNNFNVFIDTDQKSITDYFYNRKIPYNINFINGREQKGSVHALRMVKDQFKSTFIVIYGDTISNINLGDMLAYHNKNDAKVTVALTSVSRPMEGVAMLQGNKITDFKKENEEYPSYLVSAGYIIFEPEVFKYLTRDMKYIEIDLLPKLANKGLLQGYLFQGKYFNINSKEDLERARRLI